MKLGFVSAQNASLWDIQLAGLAHLRTRGRENGFAVYCHDDQRTLGFLRWHHGRWLTVEDLRDYEFYYERTFFRRVEHPVPVEDVARIVSRG